MPSKRRLRHASSTNAPQILLTNVKSGNLSTPNSSTSLVNNLFGSSSGSGSSGNTTSQKSSGLLLSTQNHHHHQHNHSTSTTNCPTSPSTTASTNNTGSYTAAGDGQLTEKQLRNAYLATLTKDQLKAECRKRGQKTTGNRVELLQRLGVKMSQLPKQQEASELSGQTKNLLQKDGISGMNSMINIKHKAGSPNGSAPSFIKKQSTKDREKEREERFKITLWRRPFQTIKYCSLECAMLTQIYGKKLLGNRTLIVGILVLVAMLGVLYKIPGQHQFLIDVIRANMSFVIYWVGLGVLSSVGFGTGLHTFLLYLGPHIASVTLAAYECNALNFPTPPYPDDLICPDVADARNPPTILNIMSKVRLEAFLWGAGTALGELPPYFMARAARLSGYDPDDAEDLQEFEELKKKKESGNLNTLDKMKLAMERVVEKIGFLGILACASIPNPLFDLAGITCGHFLVSFWTFFGATLIGKAIIKMHIQKIFVIIAFNETLIERAVDLLEGVPMIGKRLQQPFAAFLQGQKNKLHRGANIPAAESGNNILAKVFEQFVIAMIIYFIISIINSLAQSYHKRIHKKPGKVVRKLAKD